MKKFYFLLLLSTTTLLTSAQSLRINGYGAYVFEDGYDSFYDNNNYYKGQVDGGFQGGVGIEYLFTPQYCIEMMYLRRSTHAPTNFKSGVASQQKDINFDLVHDYVMLGSDGHMSSHDGKVEGYVGIFAGLLFASLDNPENNDHASSTKFAWAIRGGCNIWASDKFGIKLQTQLISSLRSAGGDFYFDPYGNPVGLSTYSSLFQFGLGGGLTYRIGK
ncbi:hypothetical protein OCK74_24535 [Chitinophagaceae bacterium LB-8]|uniref:Outer membrane protein beta-barrel domain-containing protein n=1 Tax=Paraflavisolibacter caeni TaxID=2982496 RepID=A0A9X2Y0D3_9BACT|nr:hypothetical protein [Paraflavisolibacter caeni]MCU7552310.1 hypothetical protein [Paraflavisolibacter caeni]